MDIMKFDCTADMINWAVKKAGSMNYRNSMMAGSRDAPAALAEAVVCKLVKGKLVNTFDYDIETPCGLTVDVKNKVINHEPDFLYEVTIMASNKDQKSDYLAFTYTPPDMSCVWLCGGKMKALFLKQARYVSAGEDLGNFTAKRDNYVSQVARLDSPEYMISLLSNEFLKDMRPKNLERLLSEIQDLDELYGLANRRKVLGLDLPKWTEEERRLILARKYELEQKHGRRK